MDCPCPACTHFTRTSGLVYPACQGCRIRELSRSLPHFLARQAGRMTAEYRAALEAEFGAEWKAGHGLVKAEYEKERSR